MRGGHSSDEQSDDQSVERFYERFQTVVVWLQAIAMVAIMLMGMGFMPYILLRWGWGY